MWTPCCVNEWSRGLEILFCARVWWLYAVIVCCSCFIPFFFERHVSFVDLLVILHCYCNIFYVVLAYFMLTCMGCILDL